MRVKVDWINSLSPIFFIMSCFVIIMHFPFFDKVLLFNINDYG